MHELSFPCYCWTERWFFKTVRCSSNERNTNQHLRQILDDGVCIFNNGALDFFFFGSFALAIFVAIDCTVKQNKTNTKLCYFLFNSFNAYLRIFQLNWNFVYPPFFICVLKFFFFLNTVHYDSHIKWWRESFYANQSNPFNQTCASI